jgi:hypothetical protein
MRSVLGRLCGTTNRLGCTQKTMQSKMCSHRYHRHSYSILSQPHISLILQLIDSQSLKMKILISCIQLVSANRKGEGIAIYAKKILHSCKFLPPHFCNSPQNKINFFQISIPKSKINIGERDQHMHFFPCQREKQGGSFGTG